MQQNQKMEAHKTNPPKDGVIITVYVESPKSHNKINPKTPKSTGRGRGYDRRAQLLAYSRDLRNLDSALKSKKWKRKVRSETAAPATRDWERWRYERLGAEVVDQRCLPKCLCFHTRRKRTTGKSGSSILMKMKSLLRGLSKGCKRRSDD